MPRANRVAFALLLALPGAAIVYFGFNAGGFFPGTPAFAALAIAQLLILRMLVAENPIAGFSRPLAFVVVAFSAYCLWTLLSGLWSDSFGRALIEFDRALLYLLVLVLAGSLGRSSSRMRWMLRGVVAGMFVVCFAAMLSRTFPDLFEVGPGIANNRLSFPLTYSNALGLLSAVGLLLSVALSSDDREPLLSRIVFAAAAPVFAVTVFLTFARGPMIAAALALVVFALAGRPRLFVSALVAIVPTTLVALVVAYNAELLATEDPTTAAAAAQGHRVALVTIVMALLAGAVRALLLRGDRRLVDFRLPDSRRRPVIAGATVAGVAAVVVAALAAGVPATLERQYENFVSNEQSPSGDFRARLTVLDNGFRLEFWKVALKGFESEPLRGTGAGTYDTTWLEHRETPFTATDGHSLYLETLSELGLVGLVLLALALVAAVLRLVSYCVGRERVVYAAVLAAIVAWLVHAGVDWDWEMPAATVWVFALAGMALAAPGTAARRPAGAEGEAERAPLSDGTRVVMAVCMLAAVVPSALIAISEARLGESVDQLAVDRCDDATASARSSIGLLAKRPEPYLVIGFCDLRAGNPALAAQAMRKAIEYDARSWEAHYGLAAARASSGLDPRAAAAEALRLNPKEELTRDAVKRFETDDPELWRKRGPGVAEALVQSGRSSVSDF